ncbi:MAG TPA: 4-alpha-glucanotransferase [Bryobacteraceae bacterium]|jgi:4-alpha-glucanotransferase|nr:4-alpha-glucanotransferase [Bryobacteraceae bacterium]
MSFDDALRQAAVRSGILQDYWDIFGQQRWTSPETNLAILNALGYDCSSEDSLHASMESRDRKQSGRLLPPVLVVSQNAPLRIPLRRDGSAGELELEIVTEEGEPHRFRVPAGDSEPELSLKLPLGYHELRAGGSVARLIVTPERAYTAGGSKCAGIGVMLYSLRSRRNWGCGDFRDLRDLADWAAECLHASFIALNPLHSIHNRRPYNTSPYLPNSIYYRNFIYLDVEAVPGFDCIRQKFEDGETRAEIQRLRQSAVVEYEQVAALKRRALQLIFKANPPGRDCLDWIAGEGDLLRNFATFCALDEYLHAANPDLWVWTDWPEEYRDPESNAVKEFAGAHAGEILFHGWLQWQVDHQLANVQKHARAAGMSIGLYHDMALATDRCGSDLWAHRSFYVPGCRVGSPPDGFAPSGQDWSFPPPNSERHREDGYRLFAESIRKTLRHGGALRIDHVMRLFRLYWIPPGHDASQGAYVRDRAEDLVRILALESVRGEAVIVGEDLGTVEPEIREALAAYGILSYRLLYFERNGADFKPPAEYPVQALASTTTHDLPTIAGFWTGADIEARLRAGTIDGEAFEARQAERPRDKQKLLDALVAAHLLPEEGERDASKILELSGELHSAILGYLATTPSAFWLINQEDLTKEPAQQNLPGTTSEYPNWSRKMRWSLEDLADLPEAREAAAAVRHWTEITGRICGMEGSCRPKRG